MAIPPFASAPPNNTIVTVTGATFSIANQANVFADPTSNAITLTLPAPTKGKTIIIADSTGQSATNNITINPHASEKINGVSTYTISQNYGQVRLVSNGTNWFALLDPNVPVTIPPVIALTESAGAATVNWATGNAFSLTLNANLTLTFTNATPGQTIVIRLTNTASNFTVAWPVIKWPFQTTPTMTIGAFSDVYTIFYDGTNLFGSYVQNF